MNEWLQSHWRKTRTILIALILLGGAAFIIFAVFFNRAVLSITANTPFTVEISGQQSRYCEKAGCEIVLAPGTYSYSVVREGYQPYSDEVQLRLGERVEKNYQLQQLPRLSALEDTSPQARAFLADPLPQLTAGLPSDLTYFAGPSGRYVYFLADHPKTFLPALYRKDVTLRSGSPELLLNLMRTVKKPLIRVNPEENMAVLIDQSDPQNASLYLFDLEKKSRQLLQQEVLISDALWLPAEQGRSPLLLLEKINRVTMQPSLYLLDLSTPGSEHPLSINAGLSGLVALGPQEILYAEPFSQDQNGGQDSGFTVKMMNLRTELSSDIFPVINRPLPAKIEFQSKTHLLLMLIEGTVYSLSPIL
jgi:hypothetical protein